MPDRRVIYDSEDEDAGFSPINSPAKGAAPDIAIAEDRDAGGELRGYAPTSDQRSTDSEFFQHVYHQQEISTGELIPDTASGGESNRTSSDKQKSSVPKAKNNSSSITDPTLQGAEGKGKGKVDVKDFASLTQVTTPSNGKQKDVYDFPSDNEEAAVEPTVTIAKAKTAKTHAKRKRGQPTTTAKETQSASPPQHSITNRDLSSSNHLETEANHDNTPRPAKKKRTSGAQQSLGQIPEDIDLLVIPRTAETNESLIETSEAIKDSGRVIYDTMRTPSDANERPPASFIIAPPSRLTESQKKEYVRLSGSSGLDKEENHQALIPEPQPQTQGQRSHNSDSTIAYPTPSRYCSSAAPFPDVSDKGVGDSSSLATSSERWAKLDRSDPRSSPDVLGSDSPGQTRPKAKRKKGADEDEGLACDDSWDSDKIGSHREHYKPRPSRRRSGVDPHGGVGESTQADTSARSAGKKRQKQEQHIEAPQEEDSWDSDKIGFHRETYTPRPSRRRSGAVVEDEEDVKAPEQSMPDTCPPGQTSPGGAKATEPILISSGQEAPQDVPEGFSLPVGIEGLDPDVLAALPEDIRQEVIADHLNQSGRALQGSRTRGRGRPGEGSSGLVPLPEDTPKPKKRGRKKKEQKNEATSLATEEAEVQAIPETTAPAKKKRGRPKKSETVQPTSTRATDEGVSMEDAADAADEPPKITAEASAKANPVEPTQGTPQATKAPSKRGRKKKVIEEPPAPPEDEQNEAFEDPEQICENTRDVGREEGGLPQSPSHELGESVEDIGGRRKALQDISNTVSQGSSTGDKVDEKAAPKEEKVGQEKEAIAESRAEEAPKSASNTTGQQGKVPLRVGLSKKSRLPSLLKIIRK